MAIIIIEVKRKSMESVKCQQSARWLRVDDAGFLSLSLTEYELLCGRQHVQRHGHLVVVDLLLNPFRNVCGLSKEEDQDRGCEQCNDRVSQCAILLRRQGAHVDIGLSSQF